MPLKLPRLSATLSITDTKTGRALREFTRFWNDAMGAIEEALAAQISFSDILGVLAPAQLPPGKGFIANRNGTNQTGLTAATYNKISFTNAVRNDGGYFDAATNFRFTPLQAGLYACHLGASAATGTSGETCQALIYKNGANYVEGSYLGASVAPSYRSAVSSIIYMNGTTDYLEGFVLMPAAVTVLRGNPEQTYFNCYKVSI